MSQSEKPQPPARQKTPRVPSNFLYDRVVPIALIVMAVILIVIVVIAVVGLIGVLR